MENLWDRIIAESDMLENPLIYREYFSKPIFNEVFVKRILVSSLQESTSSTSSILRAGTRVYLDNISNESFLACLRENLPRDDESIREYFTRMMGKKDFCLIIHHAEYFDDEVAQMAYKFMAPLIEKYGTPQITFECGFIIGNYKNTPFGVHHDTNGRTLHFNIGPCKKMMYTWDREDVWRITGAKRAGYSDPDQILKLTQNSTIYELDDRDLFFLPIHQYHFASTNGFSIDFVITFEKNNSTTVLRKSLASLGNRIVESKEDYYDFNKTLNFSDIDDKWLQQTIREYTLRTQSNLGFVVAPKKKKFDIPPDLYDSEDRIRQFSPYPILLDRKEGYLQIFARGSLISTIDSNEIVEFISDLNSGKNFPLRDVIRLKEQFSSDGSFYKFIQRLYESGSILID